MRRNSNEQNNKILVEHGKDTKDNVSIAIEVNGDPAPDSRAPSPNKVQEVGSRSPGLRQKSLLVPESGEKRRRSSATIISAAALRKLQAAAVLAGNKTKEDDKKHNQKNKPPRHNKMSGGAIFLAFLLAVAAVILTAILYMQLRETNRKLTQVTSILSNKTEVIVKSLMKDCAYATPWVGTEGVMKIYPVTYPDGIRVFCDQHTDGGGWTVFQRRLNGSENFYRPWGPYVRGFGSLEGEFWIGLETLYQFTSKTGFEYELRIDLEDFEGNKAFAKYRKFRIESSANKYVLHVGKFSGNARDGLKYHNGMKFSTYDSDNDKTPRQNCATTHHGGWWYNGCHSANLNGHYKRGKHDSYADGVNWHHWKGFHYSLKKTEMKMRRKI